MARRADDPLGDSREGAIAEMAGALINAVPKCWPGERSRARMGRKSLDDSRRPSEYGLLASTDAEDEGDDIPLVEAASRFTESDKSLA